MSWSITAAERPLKLGPIDNLVLHKDMAHGYLRVKNDEGKPVLELHGYARLNGLPRHAKFKFAARMVFACVADNILGHPIHNSPLLQVRAITSQKTMDAIQRGLPIFEQEIFKGSQEDVMRMVECALRTADTINKADLPFVFYSFGKEDGQNCQSIKSEICNRILGKQPAEHSPYATPGMHNDLELSVPGLKQINLDKSPLSKVTQSIQNLLKGFNADPSPLLSGPFMPKAPVFGPQVALVS